MLKVYFIRHAQSENNALDAKADTQKRRNEDPELTKLGRQQARLLADFIRSGYTCEDIHGNGSHRKGLRLTHLYSSLMVRAVQTGMEVSRAVGVPLVAWEELHEEGGIYLDDEGTGEPVGLPGKTRSFFESNYPEFVLPEELGEDGWWRGRPYEEDPLRWQRSQSVVETLLERHYNTNDRVAIVSHGGFYNLFIHTLLGLPRRNGVWFTMFNAGITRMDFLERETNVVYQNRVDFLPPDMVS